MRSLRLFFLLPAVLLVLAANAQVVIGPLGGDASRQVGAPNAAATQRTAALTLPFFDDFVTPRNGLPNAANWQGAGPGYPVGDGTLRRYAGGGAYVSNRLAVAPPTRGTVTLDGLRANGLPYNPGSPTVYGATDTLTSQPIDLSGLGPGSNVYLSYAWQAGSVQGAPASSSGNAPVQLLLEFLDRDGIWNGIWTFSSQGSRTGFRQQIFPISQAAYLHGSFRFRFRATGNQNLSRDSFGLDYIYLNSNRSAADTTFADVALSQGLSNPLRRFTSLPAWQYAAASTSELSPTLGATANRLTATTTVANPINPLPISWQGVVRELSSGGFGPATWLSGSGTINAGARQYAIAGNATTAPLPSSTGTRRYRYQLQLQTQETNPLTLANDSLSRDLELADYYAFDDGTAEASFNLTARSMGGISYFAYALDLNKNDAVKSVRLAPIFNNIPVAAQGENYADRPVTVAVWADNNGQPAATPLATKTGTLLNPLNPANSGTSLPVFQEIVFDQPVPVSGRCYVGFGQASSGQFLGYGYDLNNAAPASVVYQQTAGTWAPTTLPLPGALLMRAVMNNGVLATRAAQALNAQFSLYPNPAAAGSTVLVAGPAFRAAALLDVLGRPVWQQPAAEAGQPTLRLPATLPPGVYLVRLPLPDGSVATRRLTVQ
ncbi:T9SS type A sorting domain-containing protein [Hymenobacter sp. RP-2-7]|uniref:T9SS type A sorting domain-containing protein n=1 Tax=Hymenobacter polaris TaxID=2682546 RepID=A0A7Y0ADQ9_9BACT|nr:T9SS type A sorting domain-containing protein [Hymenobacter polaris]NML65464.1 T9SS type A sorting domain-containing protein [Hymenobacter polaris]